MKHYFLIVIIAFAFSSFTNSYCKTGQKSSKVDKKECQSLFSSSKDTILWMSNRTPFFPKEGWSFENGELKLSSGRKGGDLITRKQYTDFELSLEFNMTKFVNSGVKYFVNQMTDKSNGKEGWIGFEYQIIDDFSGKEIPAYEGVKGSTGALYLIYAPNSAKKKLFVPGKWNSMKIVVKGKHVEHWLNGKKVVDININSDDFRKRVSETKFVNYDDYGKFSGGHILLQDHGNEISFRNIVLTDCSK